MAYLISNQHTRKVLNLNIHVIDGIYNSKSKFTLHIIVVNYTNKHLTFNKGQCIGHMDLPIDNMSQTSFNSVITQGMKDEQVLPDTFKSALHNLSSEVKWSLDKLLESFSTNSQKMKQVLVWQIWLKCELTEATLNLSHINHTLLPWSTMTWLRMKSICS